MIDQLTLNSKIFGMKNIYHLYFEISNPDPAVHDSIQRSYFRPQEIKVIQNYLDPYKNPAKKKIDDLWEEKFRDLSKQTKILDYVEAAFRIGLYAFVWQRRYVPPGSRFKRIFKWCDYNKQGQEHTVFIRCARKILVTELAMLCLFDVPKYAYFIDQVMKMQLKAKKLVDIYFEQNSIGSVEKKVLKDYDKIVHAEHQFRKEMIANNFSQPLEYLNTDLNNVKKAHFTRILEESSKIRSPQPVVTSIVNNVLNQSENNQGGIGLGKRLRTFAEIEADKELKRKSGLGEIRENEQDNLESWEGWCEESSVEDKTELKFVDPYEVRKGKKKWD